MARKEEIINYANSFKGNGTENEELKEVIRLAIIDGAMWADENPDEEMIAKYLYEKKGYPIDLNGNLPSFDEAMKDTEKYLKYKQDKFIEKAANFLNYKLDDVVATRVPGTIIPHPVAKQELIEEFKTYMKG